MLVFIARALLLQGIVIALIMKGVFVSAGEYQSHFHLDMSYEYNDNIGLRETNKTSISGYNLSPGMGLSYRMGTFKADLDTTLNFSEFDKKQYNSDDQNVVVNIEKKLVNSTFSIRGGVNRDSSRTSELLDTGRVTDKAVRRENIWFAPSWLHHLNPQHALKFSGRWQDSEYQSDNFVDYNYQQMEITWIYTLSSRSAVHLQAFGRHFQNERFLVVDSDTYGLAAGGQTALSKNLTLQGLVGVMEVEADYGVGEIDGSELDTTFTDTAPMFTDTAPMLDLNLKYQHERYSWALDIISLTQPSGNGYEQESKRVLLAYDYHLTDRSDLKVRAIYGENQSVDDTFTGARSYSQFEIGLRQQVTKSWSLEGRYRALSQTRENVSADAQSSAVFLTLSYHPQHR